MTRSSSFSLWVYSALIFIGSNSLGVTHWKLDTKSNKVVPVETQHSSRHLAAGGPYLDDSKSGDTETSQLEKDEIISTLIERYNNFESPPSVPTQETTHVEMPVPSMNNDCIGSLCKNDPNINPDLALKQTFLNIESTLSDQTKREKLVKTPSRNDVVSEFKTNRKTEKLHNEKKVKEKPWTPPNTPNTPSHEIGLNCGRPTKETSYDHLEGVKKRREHPHHPEPDVIMIFKNAKSTESQEETLRRVERNLKDEMKKKPLTSETLNQVGNYWRIRGNTYLAIECFRKALSLKSDNSDVLLNLARVLYNLNYLQDAAHLARVSLDVQPPEQNSWLQHFTLGEVLESLGRRQEALSHYDHAKRLNPDYEMSDVALNRITLLEERVSNPYTLLLIIVLAVTVLWIVYTLNNMPEDEDFLFAEAQHREFLNYTQEGIEGKSRKVNGVSKKSGK